MVGVLIATHGRLAEELLASAQAIVGPLPQVQTLSLSSAVHSCEQATAELGEAIAALDTGDGVLVLANLFGGSPSQAACGFCGNERVEVVSGVNLPMVVKLATARSGASLFELAKLITAYGQKNVVHASALVRGQMSVSPVKGG